MKFVFGKSGPERKHPQARNRVRQLTWAAGALLLSLLPGCRFDPPTVAVIPRTTGISLWEPEHAGAEDAARSNGLRIYWNAPTREDDVQAQIALVERVINQNYAGLVLAPDQTLALMTPVRRALSKGIPVVIVGSPLPLEPGGKLTYVLNDEAAAGRMAAERVGIVLKGHGTVAILGINPDIAGVLDRVRFFERTLAEEYPDIKVEEKRPGLFSVPYEQQSAKQVLEAHPHLDAILAVTTDATRGAYSALMEAHLAGKVKLVGCDQDLLMPLMSGEIDSVVAEDTYQMGYKALQALADQRAGRQAPKLIRCAPRLVTKENLETPEIRRILGLVGR